jgi:hypothetical protein
VQSETVKSALVDPVGFAEETEKRDAFSGSEEVLKLELCLEEDFPVELVAVSWSFALATSVLGTFQTIAELLGSTGATSMKFTPSEAY